MASQQQTQSTPPVKAPQQGQQPAPAQPVFKDYASI